MKREILCKRLDKLIGERECLALGKTFKTQNNKYFYDTGTGKVLQCNDNVYQILRCLEKNNSTTSLNNLEMAEEQFSSGIEEIIKAIQEEHILQAHIMRTFSGAHIDALERYVNEGLEHLTLELTERCNLRCDYCIYQAHNNLFRGYGNSDMSFDIARRAIDYAALHSGEDLAVTFYGGEPLLKIDLIKKCIEYCKEKLAGKKLTFAMTSNMVLMSESVAKYIASVDNFIVTASIDGNKDIHDAHRVFGDGRGSFDAAIVGLKNYVDAVGQERIGERLTFSLVLCPPYGNDKFNAIQKFFEELSWVPQKVIKNASYVQYERQGVPDIKETENLLYEDVDPLGKWSMQQIEQTMIDDKLRIFNINDFEKTLLRIHKRRLSELPMDNIPFNACCVPGSRRLYVTSLGRFKLCEKIGLSPYIGDVYKGIDLNSIRENYINHYMKESINECKRCWAVHLCNVCYAECYDETGLRMDGKYALCEGTKYTQEKALINYHTILEKNPNALSYLNNISIK